MSQDQKPLINLGKPFVLLNGLVTDKNNYTYEQKIKLLKQKKDLKNKLPKNPKIIYHSSLNEQSNNNKNNNNNIIINNKEKKEIKDLINDDKKKNNEKGINE